MNSYSAAEAIIDAWELIEGESMRDGYRDTMRELIICLLEKRCYLLPGTEECLIPTCEIHKRA